MKRVICFFTAMLLCMHVIPICADEGVSDTIECSSQEKEAITEVINQDSYYIEHSYLYDTNSKMKKLLETDYGEVLQSYTLKRIQIKTSMDIYYIF